MRSGCVAWVPIPKKFTMRQKHTLTRSLRLLLEWTLWPTFYWHPIVCTLSAYGYSVIENNLGDVGYSTVSNQNKLYKIDLSEKKVLSTCGFVGADNEDCGRYGSSDVTITTGPFAWVFVCYESDSCLSYMCWCIFPGTPTPGAKPFQDSAVVTTVWQESTHSESMNSTLSPKHLLGTTWCLLA